MRRMSHRGEFYSTEMQKSFVYDDPAGTSEDGLYSGPLKEPVEHRVIFFVDEDVFKLYAIMLIMLI